MIITVFVTQAGERDQWRAELLEHSWMQAGQPGELVRLVACRKTETLPMHSMARVVRVTSYSPHPYIHDNFQGHNLPAALMEWLFREQIDATLLLLDKDTLMLDPVNEEIAPGGAIGNPWREWPKGEGLFGLSKNFDKLEAYCINQKLKLSKVRFPLLIHSRDLKKMVARWLELTALIRCKADDAAGRISEAHQVAYAIAAAEYHIPHKLRKLAVVPGDRRIDRPLLDYKTPIESQKGEIVWDPETYTPWSECEAARAKAGVGREFLKKLQDYATLRETGEHLGLRRPRRCHGVREARLPDRMMLQIPGIEPLLNLNSSAAAIWDLCDNQRTLSELADVLEKQYEVPRSLLCRDIDLAITYLHTGGAVELESTIHDH